MNTTQLCAKLISITALTALLAACGGSNSSSESSDSLSTDQTRVAAGIRNGLDDRNCKIMDIQLTPGGGTISKASSSLRGAIVFEYQGNVSVGDLGIYSTIRSNDRNDFISNDRINPANIELKVDKGSVFLSYDLNDEYFGSDPDQYDYVQATIYGPDGMNCVAAKDINLILTQ